MSAAELPRPPASADHRLDDPDTLWQRCCARLAMEMPEQQFNTWIRPLPAAEVRRDGPALQVSVRVPNRFMLDWVRTQYSARIEALLGEEQSGEVRLEFGLGLAAHIGGREFLHRPEDLKAGSAALIQGHGPLLCEGGHGRTSSDSNGLLNQRRAPTIK